MNLFENEFINISKIYTADMYTADDETADTVKQYPVNLNAYELIFFISGEAITDFAGKRIFDEPNSLRYLPKGIKNGKYIVKRKKAGVCIDIFFDTAEKMPSCAAGFKNMKELEVLFLKIYNVWKARKIGFYSEAMSILYEIISKIKIHSAKYLTTAQERKILPSYKYMLENFSNHDFDYKAMCEKSGLSYDYFKELFKKQYGMPPVKYVTQLRIKKAEEMLITERYTISHTALECGFENVYYFSSVFKKTVGVSPKKYLLPK